MMSISEVEVEIEILVPTMQWQSFRASRALFLVYRITWRVRVAYEWTLEGGG